MEHHFGIWRNPIFAATLLTAWIALYLVFAGEPQIDIAFAGIWFSQPLCDASIGAASCRGFALANNAMLAFIRNVLHDAPIYIGVAVLIWLIADWRAGFRWKHAGIKVKSILVIALILWPGLIVNGLLKAQWGRPRPWMTDLFGGTMPFVEAGRISDYCASNCSFVSGEASSAGWLLGLALLWPPQNQRLAYAVLAAIGAFMAVLRTGFGAHYLSDVTLGYLGALVTLSLLCAAATCFDNSKVSLPPRAN